MIESDLTSTTSSGTAIQLGNTDGSMQGCQIDSEFYLDGMQVRSFCQIDKLRALTLASLGTIYLRRLQFFSIFDPYPPSIDSFYCYYLSANLVIFYLSPPLKMPTS